MAVHCSPTSSETSTPVAGSWPIMPAVNPVVPLSDEMRARRAGLVQMRAEMELAHPDASDLTGGDALMLLSAEFWLRDCGQ